MRKTKYLALGLTPIAALAMGVGAVYAEGDITTVELLEECLGKTEEATCVLGGDIVVPATYAGSNRLVAINNKTLDLNGHKITVDSSTKFTHGIVNIGNNFNKIDVSGGLSDVRLVNHTVTIKTSQPGGEITTGDSETYAAVAINSASELNIEQGVKLTGYSYGLTGNGDRHYTYTTINGATIEGIHGTGIYHPEYGDLTIIGSTITGGETGIEIRAGNLQTLGSNTKVTSTATLSGEESNGNGTTNVGSAVAIVQHTTKLPINVELYSGTFEGIRSVFEDNTQNNTGTRGDINITLGYGFYHGRIEIREALGDNPFINPEIITAGEFQGTSEASVKALLKKGNENTRINTVATSGDRVAIVTEHKLTVAEGHESEVNLSDNDFVVAGSHVLPVVNVPSGLALVGWTLQYGDNNSEEVQGPGFTMPDAPTTITPKFGQASYSITKQAAENGSIEVASSADYGARVNITNIKPAEGYRLHSIKLIFASGGVGEATVSADKTSAYFTMPDTAVTVSPVFERIRDDKEVEDAIDAPAAVADEKKTEKVLNDTVTAMAKKDAALAAKILAAGSNVDTDIVIGNIDAKDVSQKTSTVMAEAAEAKVKGMKIANYFDITIDLYLNNRRETSLTELTEEIEFLVDVPTNLPAVPEGKTRVFYIIREHEGKATVLETKLSEDGKSLAFKSNLFSVYGVGWADVDQVTGNTAGSFVANGAKSLAVVNVLAGAAAVVGYALRKAFKKVRF